ncbi:MAG: IclR family transcriptional regulator [Bacillota bacterium]
MSFGKGETSSSLTRAIQVLKQLCKEPYAYRVSDLANTLGINRTTLYRMLNTMEEQGLVIKTESGKKYKLGPMAYQIGSVYLNSFQFHDKIFPILDRISHESQESVGLAVREGEKIISLYEIEIYQPMKMNYKPGLLYPINRGCYGKCLMAYHDQDKVEAMLDQQHFKKVCKNTLTGKEEILKEYKKIREQGYVVSDEEVFPQAVAVGIPVASPNGEIKTCVAISFIKSNGYKQKIKKLKEILFKYKDEITRYMI